jgi:membrane associated rhomboid family serine protease
MARRGAGLERAFTFGGRVPAASGFLLVALVVLFVLDHLARGAIFAWVSLSPALVLQGEIWRLATWSLLERQPISLLFAALWVWQTGGQLAWAWGTGRFLRVWFGMTAGAGVVQVLAALVFTSAGVPQAGPWAVLVGLLLVTALGNRGQQVSWFGMLPMTMETLAWILLGGTVLFAIASPAPGTFVVNFAALGIAYLIAGPGLPFRRWWYRARAELHVQSARRRARTGKLKVVKKNGQDEPPRWMN